MSSPVNTIKLNVRKFKPDSILDGFISLHIHEQYIEVEHDGEKGNNKKYYSNSVSREGVRGVKCSWDKTWLRWKVCLTSDLSVDFYFHELARAKRFKELMQLWKYDRKGFYDYFPNNPFESEF